MKQYTEKGFKNWFELNFPEDTIGQVKQYSYDDLRDSFRAGIISGRKRLRESNRWLDLRYFRG